MVSHRVVLQLTTVCPVHEVLSYTRIGDLSGRGPGSNQPTLLTSRQPRIPVNSITAVVVPTRLLADCNIGCWVYLTVQRMCVWKFRPTTYK